MAYAQPAAANYYTTPSNPAPKQRGYRLCDKCGAIEQPNMRFRLCGGCVSTNSHFEIRYRLAYDVL